MKRSITEFLEGSFIDFEGVEHKLVACAVSMSPNIDEDTGEVLRLGWVDGEDYMDSDATIYNDIVRLVTVAIAICNPEDSYDLERGKKVAYNKAINGVGELPTLFATDHGVISKAVVSAFLKQELEFAQNNPGKLIKGYNEAKEKYKKNQELEKEIDSLDITEKVLVESIINGADFDKYVRIAKAMKSRNDLRCSEGHC